MNKLKDIAIYGAGGFGREVACLINHINKSNPQWNLIGFIDDYYEAGTKISYETVLGGTDFLNNYDKPLSVAVAIANSKKAALFVDKINNKNIDFPNIISSDVLFFDKSSVSFGKGNIISFRTTISCNVILGDFNRLNGNVTLGHDVVIGNYNMLNPSTRISGNISIGDRNFFGVCSIVLQGNKIGNDTTIATNSVVIKNTQDNATYLGNPATKFKF